MGDGEFVGNMSVHWKITHKDDLDDIQLKDEHVKNREKGVNVAKKKVHGKDPDRGDFFEVTLRFKTKALADQAWAAGMANLDDQGNDGVFVTLTLPALRRDDPEDDPDPEIRVHW